MSDVGSCADLSVDESISSAVKQLGSRFMNRRNSRLNRNSLFYGYRVWIADSIHNAAQRKAVGWACGYGSFRTLPEA